MKQCAHCGAPIDGFAATLTNPIGLRDAYLCHPDEGMDCYRLVTVYSHPLGHIGCVA